MRDGNDERNQIVKDLLRLGEGRSRKDPVRERRAMRERELEVESSDWLKRKTREREVEARGAKRKSNKEGSLAKQGTQQQETAIPTIGQQRSAVAKKKKA